MLHCWTSSSDISGCRADIHVGHGTVGAGQGRSMACVNERTAWQGNGIGKAWERYAMCESALTVHGCTVRSPLTGCQVISKQRNRFSRYSQWLYTLRTALYMYFAFLAYMTVRRRRSTYPKRRYPPTKLDGVISQKKESSPS